MSIARSIARSHAYQKNSKHLPVLANWVNKGSWAIMDQGFFALANFVLNVMLARSLTPRDYGAFTVAFSVFLFMGAAYAALLIEPMLVFGPTKHVRRYSEYLNILMLGHWALVAAASLSLLVLGSILRMWRLSALSSALIGFGFSGPLILLMGWMRRVCYLRSEPRVAALAGFLYLTLTVAGLFVLNQRQWLSISSALGLMALASLITNLWLSLRLRLALPWRPPRGLFREISRDHWGYGRWAVAMMLLVSPAEFYFLVLPLWHGLDASALFKALVNLTTPLRNADTAIGLLILPALARARGTVRFGYLTSLTAVVLVAGSALYWAPLILFHRSLLAWLYGGQYGGQVEVLWFLGAYILTSPVADVLGGALRALQRPDLVFKANVLAAVAALTFGVWGIARWGVIGAGGGVTLASATGAIAMWWYLHDQKERAWRRRDTANEKSVI